MAEKMLEDAREYIFPLFLVDADDKNNTIQMAGREYLGTAFFVSKQGDAITARHVLPASDAIPQGKRVIAVVLREGKEEVCWITHGVLFSHEDLALFHVNLQDTKYLKLAEMEFPAGTDVAVIGVPSHEVWMSGKEMRFLKGHVTLVAQYLELNIRIPPGMSGSPVIFNSKAVAIATSSVSSEEVEESTEEIEVLTNGKEQIRITKTVRMTHYGLALPFSRLRDQAFPVLGDKTLMQVIHERNGE